MPYIAIVLDADSQNACIEKAIALGILPVGHPAKCHHVTLAMGSVMGYLEGATRFLSVTHYGVINGRVSAFRVEGAEDSRNRFPHVTVAVFGDAKPVESNQIQTWVPLPVAFAIEGKVTVCK